MSTSERQRLYLASVIRQRKEQRKERERDILTRFRNGEPLASIAKSYEVTHQAIRAYIKRRTSVVVL